ncbi:MAG TPA: NUDIX domain-containing protein [Caulobacteraceae bacterium]|jgi:8-oxo-dGTP pyrophosphatase MutT (NUDIX family)|nr:NUDIX domain-containing protein [Caulobacteraceae bacterium]
MPTPEHPPELLKVTCFVIRAGVNGPQVLLLRHPFAGMQFPAGTVEQGEAPEAGAAREAREETGLAGLGPPRLVGERVERLAPPAAVALITSPLYPRPDLASHSWATLRNGFNVVVEREAEGFIQVTYEEWDRAPDPQYVTYRLTGWVAAETLTRTRRRFFYVLPCEGETAEAWEVTDDGHTWTLFWAPVAALPAIIPPQDQWVPYLAAAMGPAP